MQLHCLAELKLERESIVYNAFISFKFDEGFFILEVVRMDEDSSKSSIDEDELYINYILTINIKNKISLFLITKYCRQLLTN